MISTNTQPSNELRWLNLMIEQPDSGRNNARQGDMPIE